MMERIDRRCDDTFCADRVEYPDIDMEKEVAVIRGKVSNSVLSMIKTMNFIFRILQESTTEIYEACRGKDLIIVSHRQMGAIEAGVLGIPTVNVTFQTEMIEEKLKAPVVQG